MASGSGDDLFDRHTKELKEVHSARILSLVFPKLFKLLPQQLKPDSKNPGFVDRKSFDEFLATLDLEETLARIENLVDCDVGIAYHEAVANPSTLLISMGTLMTSAMARGWGKYGDDGPKIKLVLDLTTECFKLLNICAEEEGRVRKAERVNMINEEMLLRQDVMDVLKGARKQLIEGNKVTAILKEATYKIMEEENKVIKRLTSVEGLSV